MTRFLARACALWITLGALAAGPALAQDSPAAAAKRHFLGGGAASGQALAQSADLVGTDLEAVSEVYDRSTGLTHVYLVQQYRGVEVYGTLTSAAVTRAGAVHAVADRFEGGVPARAGAPEPALGPEAASDAALRYVRALAEAHVREADREGRLAVSDDPATDRRRREAAFVAGPPRLVYQPVEGGALRLAWALDVVGVGGAEGQHQWAVRVDARTGAVLAADDLVVRHAPGEHGPPQPLSLAPLAPAPLVVAPAPLVAAPAHAAGALAGSYRVVPFPLMSPAEGDLRLVARPANPAASPLGWHATPAQSFTTTQGNNAHAYADRSSTNLPDEGSAPDGGPGLTFDFPFDPDAPPLANQRAAVTNAFYWANLTHDLLYPYGFDEAGGNFQVDNLGRGGRGGDPVLVEVQDGSGLNNANFTTPADGASPRMQLFEWRGRVGFAVDAPTAIAGDRPAVGASFGPRGQLVQTRVVPVAGPGGPLACAETAVSNGAALAGQIALVERGECNFLTKARVAQALGAAGLVVYNSAAPPAGTPESLQTMGLPDGETDDVRIPSVFVARSTGVALATSPVPPTGTLRVRENVDSAYDAGIIVHEYVHGLTNRLTGGPDRVNCLGNREQMGEGWSDYYALMLTQGPGAGLPRTRSIGTYLVHEPPDGAGFRNAPYATSFALNDYTYQDVITHGGQPGSPRSLSVPHGVGFVWGAMLWDLTWNLIDRLGYSPDVHDAAGRAGNQVALRLVTQALKLQPCQPGFVDGRNAILKADELLYGAAHHDEIWRAFARRGLGSGARQGSTNVLNDGVASFALPSERPDVEDIADRLELDGPNPFRSRTTVLLEVREDQDVLVALYDLLGRRVRVLHDGPITAGARTPIEVFGEGLAAGVYLLRAAGETYQATQRLTLVR